MIEDNARLNEEVKRSMLQLARVDRELRQAQAGGTPTGGGQGDAASSQQLAELARNLEDLKGANQKLTEENRRLAASGDAAALQRRLQTAEAELTARTTALQKAQADLTAAQQRPAAAAPAADNSRVKQLEDDLTAARTNLVTSRRETETLRAQVSGSEEIAAQAIQVKRQLDDATAQLRQLQAASAAGGQAQGAGAAQVAELRTSLETTRRELAAAQAAATQAQSASAQNQTTVSNQLNESKTAAERLQQTVAQLTMENQRLATAVARTPAAPAPAPTAGPQLAQLQTELTGLQQARAADRTSLDRATVQLEAATRSIADLTNRNSELQKDLEVAKQSTAAALAAQASAVRNSPGDAMRLEMRTLQDQVTALEARIEEDRKNSADQVTVLATQLRAARDSSRSLAEANRALMEAKGSDDSTTKAELAALTQKVKEMSAANEKLRQDQQNSTEWTKERDNLRAQLDDMFTKLTAAERSLVQLRTAGEAASRQGQTAQADVVQARTEIANLSTRLAASEKVAATHNATVAELTGLNEKLTSERATLQTQLRQMQAAADKTAADLADLRQRQTANDRVSSQQSAQVAELGTANDRLQDQLATLQTKLAEAEKATDQHGSSVADLTGTNEKLATENKNLQAQVSTLATQLSSVRADTSRLAQLEQARLDSDQRTQRLEQENAAVAARLRQAQGTLDQIASAARVISGATGGSSPITLTAQAPNSNVPVGGVATRIHTVAEGDSLTRISTRYYGTPNRWQDIYDANGDTLKGASSLKPGQKLRIP